jgi:glutathione synthase/RimK-type ligase-like ATP-grasp enzyme
MFGVLSINKRNIEYVRRWNDASAIALAKNKYKSKVFFSERNIPVPATYALIESYDDLLLHDFS